LQRHAAVTVEPYRSAMKVLLNQITSAGKLAIGAAPDGRFHVLWKDASVGSAGTVRAALELACDPARSPGGDGRPPVRVSPLAEDWFVAP
jgi:hypothetical protein